MKRYELRKAEVAFPLSDEIKEFYCPNRYSILHFKWYASQKNLIHTSKYFCIKIW
jgi:hypothetical protein